MADAPKYTYFVVLGPGILFVPLVISSSGQREAIYEIYFHTNNKTIDQSCTSSASLALRSM